MDEVLSGFRSQTVNVVMIVGPSIWTNFHIFSSSTDIELRTYEQRLHQITVSWASQREPFQTYFFSSFLPAHGLRNRRKEPAVPH